MSRVFMVFAASGENLFEARCGAKDFFDSLKSFYGIVDTVERFFCLFTSLFLFITNYGE